MKTHLIALFSLAVLLTLTACAKSGGGSGGGSVPNTGQLAGPMEGVRYSTASQSGETNATGEFLYLDGETVTFAIGDIVLGSVTAAASLSLADVAGTTLPVTGPAIRLAVNRINSIKYAEPLEVAANLAVFLYTLDDDGDASNGVQVPAQMHTLATGVSLDFNQSRQDFPQDFPLRQLLAAGRSAGLWGGARPVRNPALALDALYTSLGLIPQIWAFSQSDTDGDGDGPGGITDREIYAYDANSNWTLWEIDGDGDGPGGITNRRTYAYDVNGNQTLADNDPDGDGPGGITYRETTAYDANGNRTLYERDADGDGPGGITRRETWAYDTNGNPTLYEKDADGDARGVLRIVLPLPMTPMATGPCMSATTMATARGALRIVIPTPMTPMAT